jgi:uncharacterized membrane protein
MTNRLKKGISIAVLLAMLSCTALSAVPASAEEDSTSETVNEDDYSQYNDQLTYYVNDDNTITIVSCYDTDEDGNDITAVEVPEKIDGKKVVEIGEQCFYQLTSLVTVTLPDTIETINSEAFSGCSALTTVNVPKKLKTIGDDAFNSCEVLASFELPQTLESIGSQSFYDCQLIEEFDIPESCTEIGDYAFEGCVALVNVIVDENNTAYTSIDGILYDKELTTLIKFPEKNETTDFVVPDTVTEIANWAFVGCTTIETVDLSNVQTLGEDAFYYCTSLESVTIPEGITELVGSTFGYCIKLSEINLPSTLETIGDYAFYCCASLTEVVIPDNVTSIGNYAFFYCQNLKKVTVPTGVSELGTFCLGYTFDSDTSSEVLIDGFVLDCEEDSPAYLYGQDNGIFKQNFNLFKTKVSIGSLSVYVWVLILIGLIIIAAVVVVILIIRSKREQKRKEQENLANYKRRKEAAAKRLERQRKANIIGEDKDKKGKK